jgi:hypothetical protein
VMALAGVVEEVAGPLRHGDLEAATSASLDAVFLAVILLELVNTTLSRGPMSLQVQEFLVVGITSGVRKGLEIAAHRGGDQHAEVIDLAVNALGVTLLVGALWLMRRSLQDERGRGPRRSCGAGGTARRELKARHGAVALPSPLRHRAFARRWHRP